MEFRQKEMQTEEIYRERRLLTTRTDRDVPLRFGKMKTTWNSFCEFFLSKIVKSGPEFEHWLVKSKNQTFFSQKPFQSAYSFPIWKLFG